MIKKLLTLFLTLSFHISFAQSVEEQTDSLLHLIKKETPDSTKAAIYNTIAATYDYNQPVKSAEFAQKALQISKQINNFTETDRAYMNLSLAHYYQGSPADTLLKYIQLLEKHINTKRIEGKMMRVYWMYAMYYSNVRQPDKEIESYMKALELVRKEGNNTETETGLLHNIGSLLLQQKKYSEAMIHFREGLKKVKGEGLKADILHSIGLIHEAQEEYDMALEYFEKAYEGYSKVDDYGKMAVNLSKKGKYYDNKRQFERANKLYFEALELTKLHNIGLHLTEILSSVAGHYQARQNYSEAIKYGEISLKEIADQKNYSVLLETYDILQESYSAIGNYKRAYEIRGEQINYKDSISNVELLTKVESLQSKFKLKQKETENELLKVEALANQETIQSKNITGIALLLGLLLLGSWAVVVFRSNRRKQKYNQELEATVAERTVKLQRANYELKTFNFIASHDIKEPIRNIGNYSGLIYRKLPEALQTDLKSYFETINCSASQLYTLVEDISKYTQMSGNDDIEMESVDLNLVVSNLKMNLGHLTTDKKGLITNQKLPSVRTNSSLIYTILKSIVENGLKFNESQIPKVSISTKEYKEYTEISIEDNGIGIELEYQKQIFEMFKKLHNRGQYKGSGMGLAIVKLLVDKIGATVQVKSEHGKGSTFIVRIPNI